MAKLTVQNDKFWEFRTQQAELSDGCNCDYDTDTFRYVHNSVQDDKFWETRTQQAEI